MNAVGEKKVDPVVNKNKSGSIVENAVEYIDICSRFCRYVVAAKMDAVVLVICGSYNPVAMNFAVDKKDCGANINHGWHGNGNEM